MSMTNEQLNQVRTQRRKNGDKFITNEPSYDILALKKYSDAMMFKYIDERNSKDEDN